MAQRISRALNELSSELGLSVITPEYQILMTLLGSGRLSTDDLQACSSLSRSGFFHVVDRLKHRRLITCEVDPHDHRRKTYQLNPHTRAQLLRNLKAHLHNGLPHPVRQGQASGQIGPANCTPDWWKGDLRLRGLSCECEILFYLFMCPGAANCEIAAAVSASATKFNAVMRRLTDLDLIWGESDGHDKRRKRYRVADSAEIAIRKTHQKLHDVLVAIEQGADTGEAPAATSHVPARAVTHAQ